jgi:hypothetical protein
LGPQLLTLKPDNLLLTNPIGKFSRYLVVNRVVKQFPVEGVDTPKRERNSRSYLTPEEYSRLLDGGGRPPASSVCRSQRC